MPCQEHPKRVNREGRLKNDLNSVRVRSQPFSNPADVITLMFTYLDVQQRFTCALVCSDWSKAAAAMTTNSVVRHGMRDFTRLQRWLEENGSQVEALQLHGSGVMAGLPCAQLQDLLLNGPGNRALWVDSRVWRDIAAATKLTSVSLSYVVTPSRQAYVMSALTALSNLEQLTWRDAVCVFERELFDSRLLQQLTRLTSLELRSVAAAALQHLSSLTKLQRLSMHSPIAWATAGYPGLQELQGLKSLVLHDSVRHNSPPRFPACVSQLTALQQLEVCWATIPELATLSALTALTKLQVANLSPSRTVGPTPLQFPVLQRLVLRGDERRVPPLHMSSLASCSQLLRLSLCHFCLTGPGNLVASSMLQQLDVRQCHRSSDQGGPAAMPPWEIWLPWEIVLPGPGRLPHLTSLVLRHVSPQPQQPDVERLVACCSGLLELQLDSVTDEQCTSLAQLIGLQDLDVSDPGDLSAVGLRHLAGLKQLTSLEFGPSFDPRKVSIRLLLQLSDNVQGHTIIIVNKVRVGCLVPGTLLECGGVSG